MDEIIKYALLPWGLLSVNIICYILYSEEPGKAIDSIILFFTDKKIRDHVFSDLGKIFTFLIISVSLILLFIGLYGKYIAHVE